MNAIAPSITLTGGLFLVFLTLKLTDVIGWSWWWVSSPIWAPAIMAFVCVLIYLIVVLLKELREDS